MLYALFDNHNAFSCSKSFQHIKPSQRFTTATWLREFPY